MKKTTKEHSNEEQDHQIKNNHLHTSSHFHRPPILQPAVSLKVAGGRRFFYPTFPQLEAVAAQTKFERLRGLDQSHGQTCSVDLLVSSRLSEITCYVLDIQKIKEND